MSFRRLRAIARKEVLHVIRDPRSLASAIAIPLIMLLIFGYALSLDVDHIPTIVYNLDQSPGGADLVRDFRGSRYFTIIEEAHSYRPIEQAMDSRRAQSRLYSNRCRRAITAPAPHCHRPVCCANGQAE